MKNSIELCHPLRLPFYCRSIDSRDIELPADWRTHYYAELFLLQEGNLQVRLDREESLLVPGDALVICPGVKHRITLAEEAPLRMNLIRMDPDRLPELPAYSPGLKSILQEAWREKLPMLIPAAQAAEMKLSELTSQCIREAAAHRFGYDLMVNSLLSALCMSVIRFWLGRGLNLAASRPEERPIYSLTGYIQRHLRDNLRVEDLAARCGLSYPWFAKKFREVYGVSCKDYIEQIRVAQVENFLLYTDMDLTRISEETGYADCSHMIKNFKRMKEITPGQYRLKHRQDGTD